MKGRIKMPVVDWIKLIAISAVVICSTISFAYGCNVATVGCYHHIVR